MWPATLALDLFRGAHWFCDGNQGGVPLTLLLHVHIHSVKELKDSCHPIPGSIFPFTEFGFLFVVTVLLGRYDKVLVVTLKYYFLLTVLFAEQVVYAEVEGIVLKLPTRLWNPRPHLRPRLNDFERVKEQRAKSVLCRPFRPHCNMPPYYRTFNAKRGAKPKSRRSRRALKHTE